MIGYPLRGALLLSVMLVWLAGSPMAWSAEPRLALIVDDLGYDMAQGQRVIALPGPLTVAVLPFTPNARALADLATAAGKEVILHQPMQPLAGPTRVPGELTVQMSDVELRQQFALALAQFPQAVGVNNHTGSLLTAQRRPMRSLMREVGARGLFFLDSRTTAATVARDVAEESGVPAVRRDVFLDHSIDAKDIASEFERAVAIARRQGYAVLIAHPHEVSLRFLETELPRLEARGIRQIPLTSLISTGVSIARTTDRTCLQSTPNVC